MFAQTVHVFTRSGQFSVTGGPLSADCLVIASGGCGGNYGGGGGGFINNHSSLLNALNSSFISIGEASGVLVQPEPNKHQPTSVAKIQIEGEFQKL